MSTPTDTPVSEPGTLKATPDAPDQYKIDFLRALNEFKVGVEGTLSREEYDLVEGRFAFALSIYAKNILRTFAYADRQGKDYLNAANLTGIQGFILEDLVNLLKRLNPETPIGYPINDEHPNTAGDIVSLIDTTMKNREHLFSNLKEKLKSREIRKADLRDELGRTPYWITRAFGIRELVVDQLMFELEGEQVAEIPEDYKK